MANQRASVLAVIGVIAPIFIGLLGFGVHFIPNPPLRFVALVLGLLYGVLLVIVIRKRSSAEPPPADESPFTPLKLVAAVILMPYFVYVGCFMTIPAMAVEFLGEPATKEFVIESLEKASSRARGCPYRLRLQGAVTVLDDSFCVSQTAYSQYAGATKIRLEGAESVLGFRFRNID